jgi:hypothetical protein
VRGFTTCTDRLTHSSVALIGEIATCSLIIVLKGRHFDLDWISGVGFCSSGSANVKISVAHDDLQVVHSNISSDCVRFRSSS